MPNTISLFESIPTTTEKTAQKSIPYLNTNYKDALFFQGYSSYLCNNDNENRNKRNISTSSLKRCMHHIASSLGDDHGIRTRDFQTKHYATVMARVNEKSITEYVNSNKKMETETDIQITHSATVVTNIDRNRKLTDETSKHTLSTDK